MEGASARRIVDLDVVSGHAGGRGLCCVLCRMQDVIPSHRGLDSRRRSGRAATEVNLESWMPSSHARAAGIIVERRIQRGPSQHVIAPGIPNVKR